MRFVYMDEAGISAIEPVTVVVAVIAHADAHVMSGESLAAETLGAVPAQFRNEMVFSAKNILGDKKWQKASWSLTDRLNLLCAMMRIPRKLGMALSVGLIWRNANDWSAQRVLKQPDLTNDQWDHLTAFRICVARADAWIRNNAGAREVATIIAEDHEEMRKHLRNALVYDKLFPRNENVDGSGHRITVSDEERGYIAQNGDFRVTRIRASIHFVQKHEEVLVQIADACAFGLRRYFAGEQFGAQFASAIFGDVSYLRDFASPGGAGCWGPAPNPEWIYREMS